MKYQCIRDSQCPTFTSNAMEKPTVCPYCGNHGVKVIEDTHVVEYSSWSEDNLIQ